MNHDPALHDPARIALRETAVKARLALLLEPLAQWSLMVLDFEGEIRVKTLPRAGLVARLQAKARITAEPDAAVYRGFLAAIADHPDEVLVMTLGVNEVLLETFQCPSITGDRQPTGAGGAR